MDMADTLELEETEVIDSIGTDFSAKVILFNDEIHSFDEVIEQLIKALRCSRSHAEGLTYEVHSKGKSAVFEGELQEALRITSILSEIALNTVIEY
jgi:ATP-dependent Clp protease adaptor protein ClpS